MGFVPEENAPYSAIVHEIAESLSGDNAVSSNIMEQQLLMTAPDTNDAIIVLGIVEDLHSQGRLSPAACDFFADYFLDQANANFDENGSDPNQQYNIRQIIDATFDLANGAASISKNIKTRNAAVNTMAKCYAQMPTTEKPFAIINMSRHVPQNSGAMEKLIREFKQCIKQCTRKSKVRLRHKTKSDNRFYRKNQSDVAAIIRGLIEHYYQFNTTGSHPMRTQIYLGLKSYTFDMGWCHLDWTKGAVNQAIQSLRSSPNPKMPVSDLHLLLISNDLLQDLQFGMMARSPQNRVRAL